MLRMEPLYIKKRMGGIARQDPLMKLEERMKKNAIDQMDIYVKA